MSCLQEQRLKFLKQQDQRQQQQAAEQEKLKRLKEIAENQEAKLKKVRALKGHVEQKRLSNGKLGKLLLAEGSLCFFSWSVVLGTLKPVGISVIQKRYLQYSKKS